MKINMTVVYLGIMLPLTMGYISMKKQKGESGGLLPLIFLIGLVVINYFKVDNFWGILLFRIRGLFL